eukprot:SAG31_NODE_3318_length_4420_cov_2.018051_5_plen_215_part_01
MDYLLQTAEGNAGVVAQQLCLERNFDSLACLGGSSEPDTCVDDPEFADATYNSPCSAYVVGQRNHNYCDSDTDVNGRLAAQACPAACGACTPRSSTSPGAILSDLHNRACEMAGIIGQGYGLEALLMTTDVPPLSFSTYHNAFSNVRAYLNTVEQTFDSIGEQADLQQLLSQQSELATNADDRHLLRDVVSSASDRMEQYHGQIQGIDQTIRDRM